MKTKPRNLTYLTWFLLAIGIAMPIQIMFLYEQMPWEIGGILAKLAPLNWIVMGLSILTAFLMNRASPWLIVALPSLVTAVIYNNWFVAELGEDFPPLLVGLGTGAFLASMSSVLNKKTRELILTPERRWWMTPTRHLASVPVQMLMTGSKKGDILGDFATQTFDLSLGGAFLELAPDETAKRPIDLPVGTRFLVRLNLQGMPSIQCKAEVVRIASPRGHYPEGIGIRFVQLGGLAKRRLSAYLERQLQAQTAGKRTMPMAA